MEAVIYEEIIARLKSATALAAYTDAGIDAPVTYAWFEGQPDQAVLDENNITYPFDMPAIFIQFSPTVYTGSPFRQKGSGEFTLHVVQSKLGKDGREDDETHQAFKDLLPYIDTIIALLDGYKLDCSARPSLTGVERDHTNRPIMVDQVKFSWSGTLQMTVIEEVAP